METKNLCYPSKKSFPSISITGEECHFSCIHCNHKYLRYMIHVTQENLYQKAIELHNKGVKGFLISGGLDENGKVPVDYSILEKIKRETSLTINLHSGFLTKEDAKNIKKSGIDAVSIDFVGSNDTVKNILKMPFKVSDYEDTVRYLVEEGVNVVPHICVGLDRGKVVGEYNAVEILKKYPINSLTLLVLIKNEFKDKDNIIYDIESIKEFFLHVRKSFPDTILSLGCMRPRIRELDEMAPIFDNIVNPSKNMIKFIRNKESIVITKVCCSVC